LVNFKGHTVIHQLRSDISITFGCNKTICALFTLKWLGSKCKLLIKDSTTLRSYEPNRRQRCN